MTWKTDFCELCVTEPKRKEEKHVSVTDNADLSLESVDLAPYFILNFSFQSSIAVLLYHHHHVFLFAVLHFKEYFMTNSILNLFYINTIYLMHGMLKMYSMFIS